MSKKKNIRKINKIFIPFGGNVTTTLIVVPVGSRNEPNNIKGISHFLEHMMFKGTKKRTAKQIAHKVEKYGALFNAFTDDEITAYWIKSSNKYKNVASDVLLDMVTNSIIPVKELKKERKVVFQELKMNRDDPKRHIWDVFSENLFKKESGLCLPGIGNFQSLKDINRKKMVRYYTKNYKDLTIIQVGDVKKQESKNSIGKRFKEPAFNKIKGRKNIIIKKPGITQAVVLMGNLIRPNKKFTDVDRYYMYELFDAVLSGMSGRLFSIIREKHNLVYGIHFCFVFYSCGSYVWYVYLALNTDKIDMAYDLIMKELTRPLSKKEINYALTKKIGEIELTNSDSKNIAKTIAYCLRKNLDYDALLYDYKKHLKKAAKNINSFIKTINFRNNLVTQIIPSKEE